MKIINKRDFAIKISGNHYFACDYVFSNVYGDSVLTEDEPSAIPGDFMTPEDNEEMLLDTLPETHLDGLATLPECSKEVEYMTEGSVHQEDKNGIFIRYGSDESPMCIHIRDDGVVTLSGDEYDAAEIVFEKGKRNFIALPANLFDDGICSKTDDLQSPLHLCVSTDDIKSNMTKDGGSLTVSYSIEVNGIVAEVTDFTLTADSFKDCDKNCEA